MRKQSKEQLMRHIMADSLSGLVFRNRKFYVRRINPTYDISN